MDAENITSFNFMLTTEGPNYHYCYIESFSRLLYSQQNFEGNHLHYCVRCLQGFTRKSTLEKHRALCKGASSRPARVEMPEKGKNTLEFRNYHRQMKAPFLIYADCESIIEKIDTSWHTTNRKELYHKNRNAQALRLLFYHCKIRRRGCKTLFLLWHISSGKKLGSIIYDSRNDRSPSITEDKNARENNGRLVHGCIYNNFFIYFLKESKGGVHEFIHFKESKRPHTQVQSCSHQ